MKSAPAFSNVRLSVEEENQVYLDLAEFLNKKHFYTLSIKCLSYISDQEMVRVKFTKAKSLMCAQKISDAEQQLYDIFTNVDPDLMEAHILYGHCKFLRNHDTEALHAYFTSIRIANINGQELKDPLVHQRIGSILIKQCKWKDAKVMFELCSHNYETAFSYMNLGVACLYLGDYDSAEKVL